MAIASAFQIFIPNTIGLIMLSALVVRASGESDAYLSWAIFTALAVCGASMILFALRFRRLGAGRLIVTNFNVPFLAVCALALEAGGPSLLASLMVASTLVQFVLTLRLASLRRIFTSTVSGVVVMLVALSAVPYIVSSTVIVPEGQSTIFFLAPGLAALAVGVVISLQGTPLWRMWILPVTVGVGLLVAVPMGLYDIDFIVAAPWVSLPGSGWPGLDLTFDADFWALLPVFVFVNLTAFVKTVGDLSIIYRASERNPAALDYREVQGGPEHIRGRHPLLWLAGNIAGGRALGGYYGLHRLHRRGGQERRDIPRTDDYGSGALFQAAGGAGGYSQPGGQRGVRHHLRYALRRGRENGLRRPG